MNASIDDHGNLVVNITDLLRRNEEVLREVTKHALFDDFVLAALATLFVSGEIQWSESESPWWIGASDHGPNFEKARAKLCELASEGARLLVHELQRQRDIAMAEAKVYQYRAWDAEHLVKYHSDAIQMHCLDEHDREKLRKVCETKAHAEIDWSKIMERKPSP